MGRHRRVRPDVHGRLRHQRRHLDERRRQPGRGARGVRPARRSLRDADRRIDGGRAGDAAHDRAGLRHAAALQPGRQADRLHQRSRRPVQHLGDGRRRQEPDRRVARGEVVGEQPDLGAGRRLHLRPQALRVDAVARRRRGVDVSPQRRRRRPGDREGELPEGRRRAGALAGRQVPLLQQGRHAEPDLRVRQEPARRHLRDHPPRAGDGPRAIDRQRRRRRDHAARLARREVAGVHPPRRHRQPAVRPQPRDRRRAADLRAPRQGPAGGLDDLRPLRAVRVAARHQGAGGVGRGEDLAGRSAGGRAGAGRAPAGRPRDPVRRQGRADDHRGGPLPGDGGAGSLPRPHAARRGGRAGREERRLQRARQAVDPAAAGGHAEAPDRPRRSRVRARRSRPTDARSSTRRGATSSAGGSAPSAPTAAAGARWSRRPATTSSRRSRATASASSIAPSAATTCAGRTTASSPASSSCRPPAARPRSCARRASNPRFDATGTRLYFQERRGDRTVLASVTTGNAFEIVHARSENALELVPSPDGRWIAFEERWRTYVAALPQSGRPIEIGPTTQGVPGRARLARLGLEPALVRRGHHSLDARRGSLHPRPGEDVCVRPRRRREARRARGGRRRHRLRAGRATRRAGRSRWSAPASCR